MQNYHLPCGNGLPPGSSPGRSFTKFHSATGATDEKERERCAITEKEKKAVKFVEKIKKHSMVTLDHIAKEEPNVSPLLYEGREENADAILAMIEELQRYRDLENHLQDMFCSSTSLKAVVDELERNLKEPGSPHPMKARILTYEESADWDAYRVIGTPEELQTMKEYGGFTGVELANIAAMQMRLKEYEAIGTVEEYQEVVDKQTAKKVKQQRWMDTKCDCGYEFSEDHGDGYYSIPIEKKTKYCPNCGQKLDWGDEE